jgi:hypothetical protein
MTAGQATIMWSSKYTACVDVLAGLETLEATNFLKHLLQVD